MARGSALNSIQQFRQPFVTPLKQVPSYEREQRILPSGAQSLRETQYSPQGIYVHGKGSAWPWLILAGGVAWVLTHPTEPAQSATALRAALAAPTQPAARTAVGQTALAAGTGG